MCLVVVVMFSGENDICGFYSESISSTLGKRKNICLTMEGIKPTIFRMLLNTLPTELLRWFKYIWKLSLVPLMSMKMMFVVFTLSLCIHTGQAEKYA